MAALAENPIDGFRFSPQQARIWTLQRNGEILLSSCVVSVHGGLDTNALRRALDKVVARHEILRTRFESPPGSSYPLQILCDQSTAVGPRYVWTEYDYADRNFEIEDVIQLESGGEFDLAGDPLVRLALVRIRQGEQLLVLTLPSICGDARSLKNIVAEIGRFYQDPHDATTDHDCIQYADFAAWSDEPLSEEDEEAVSARAYWAELDWQSAALFRPHAESPQFTERGSGMCRRRFQLSHDLAAAIMDTASSAKVETSDLLLACWQILLSRLTGNLRLVTGVEVDGRWHEDLQMAVGAFAYWLPFESRLRRDMPFNMFLRQTASSLDSGLAIQEYFVPGAGDPHAAGQALSFSTGFIYYELSPARFVDGLRLTIERIDSIVERCELALKCVEHEGEYRLEVLYDKGSYTQGQILRLVGEYERTLMSAVGAAGALIEDLEIVSESERRQILERNEINRPRRRELLIHETFEEQARDRRDAIAVVAGEMRITYGELNRRGDRLARRLKRERVEVDDLVGLCVDRSIAFIVGVLGALKAGGAYVPMEVGHPEARLRMIIEESGIGIVLAGGECKEKVTGRSVTTLDLESASEVIGEVDEEPRRKRIERENLAYVIYTSGTSGRPKGVMITHRGVMNYVESISERLGLEAGEKFAMVSTVAADLGNTALYGALLTGGELHLVDSGTSRDRERWGEYVEREGIENVKIVPAHMKALLSDDGKGIPSRRIVFGGERLERALANRVKLGSNAVEVINHYGPTETTVGSVMGEVSPEDQGEIAIGWSIGNTRLYVMDERYRLSPIGVRGELYIGGEGVARGYLKRPDQTAERFLPDPFSMDGGQRIYRTGDICRQMEDGRVIFLGRGDHQVKIRGFRVELPEIESVLLSHENIKDACVIDRDDANGDRFLVAYLVADDGHFNSAPQASSARRNGEAPSRSKEQFEDQILREVDQYLRSRLPEYSVPSVFVFLDFIPTTNNGKKDRQVLSDRELSRTRANSALKTPRNEVEEILSGIWCELLGIDHVGADDDFFRLGGHSLLAARMILRVRKILDCHIALRDLFDAPTLAGLAERIDHSLRASAHEPYSAIPKASRDHRLPLSFAQERLWAIDQMEPGNSEYNITAAVLLSGELNFDGLRQAFNHIVLRHESLRTVFRLHEGEPCQIILDPPHDVNLEFEDLTELSSQEREDQALKLVNEEAIKPFELSDGPLLRVKLLKLADNEHLACVTVHHIVSDGWSMGIFITEMGSLYNAYANGRSPNLPDLKIQYADYAMWQRNWAQGQRVDDELKYWSEQLNGVAVLRLKGDKLTSAKPGHHKDADQIQFDEALSENIRSLSRREGVTTFITLLTGFKVVLRYLTGQDDVAVGTNTNNRNRSEIDGLIGFFVNQVVLRSSLSGNPTFMELLARVRKVVLGALAHQDLPLGMVLRTLRPDRDHGQHPLSQINIDFQRQGRPLLTMDNLTVKPFTGARGKAHFDFNLALEDTDRQIISCIEYKSDLFDVDTISRIHQLYHHLLKRAVDQPNVNLHALMDLLGQRDQEILSSKRQELQQVTLSMLETIKRKKTTPDHKKLI
jgi:amino acid adenylation domain-containing protein